MSLCHSRWKRNQATNATQAHARNQPYMTTYRYVVSKKVGTMHHCPHSVGDREAQSFRHVTAESDHCPHCPHDFLEVLGDSVRFFCTSSDELKSAIYDVECKGSLVVWIEDRKRMSRNPLRDLVEMVGTMGTMVLKSCNHYLSLSPHLSPLSPIRHHCPHFSRVNRALRVGQ